VFCVNANMMYALELVLQDLAIRYTAAMQLLLRALQQPPPPKRAGKQTRSSGEQPHSAALQAVLDVLQEATECHEMAPVAGVTLGALLAQFPQHAALLDIEPEAPM
jgi:hypothetical protein